MTKELELLKRWVGEISLPGMLGNVEIWEDSPKITIWVNDVPYFTKYFLKELILNENFHSFSVEDIREDTFMEYTYNIPFQYQKEWKKYVKENTK